MRTIEIHHIFIDPEHGFVGRDPLDARARAMQAVEAVECVAGKGLAGDRYFGHKPGYIGQATFFSGEVFAAACERVGANDCPPWAMRRNIMISGVDLNDLIGCVFEIGGVRFHGAEECAPCRWMDRAIGAGAREYLQGRGGLRARILGSGTLHCGRHELRLVSRD